MAKKDVTKPISLAPRGGLPIGNIVLLAGTVGSGKTT